MSKLANVKYGTAQLPSGKKIEVGFRQWYEWLENPETKSFRVNDGEGYTCRKETANGYWYAYRKVGGKLHKRYIGLSKALTLRRLAEVGELFDVPSKPKLPKPAGNLRANEKLHNELSNLQANNLELQNQIGNLQAENEALKAELAEVRWRNAAPKASQVSPNTHNGNLGNLTLEADLAEAKSEIAALKRDYEESVTWYKNAHTKMSDELHKVKKADISFMIPQIKAERDRYADELAKANKQIIEMAEKNAKLQFVELPKLRAQLSSQTAPQNSEILDWPDPAALLNQLKSKRKKSRVDLQDVEAILELLLEMPAQKPKFFKILSE